MRSIVVYFSQSGNTKSVAQKIASVLGSDLLELVPVKAYPTGKASKFIMGGMHAVMGDKPKLNPYSFDHYAYNTVILCSPIWAGTIAPPLRTFVAEQNIAGKKIGFVFCSSSEDTSKAYSALTAAVGIPQANASLTLVDPLKHPSEENEALVKEFIKKISVK